MSHALPFTLLLAVLAVTVAAPAQAASSAVCEAMLTDIDLARASLHEYDRALAEIDAERRDLVAAQSGVDRRLVGAHGRAMLQLRAQRDGMALELTLIDSLRPDIASQAAALRETIDHDERGYIACIEAELGP